MDIVSSTCVDWFKFKTVLDFDKCLTPNTQEYEFYEQLCNVLRVNPAALTYRGGGQKYKARYILDSDINILTDPAENVERYDKKEYFLVDMSGQSCRSFEGRGGSWLELFKFYLDRFYLFEGHRIDLALDDFKYTQIAAVLRQVRAGAYSGTFRGKYSPTEYLSDFLGSVRDVSEESFDKDILEKCQRDGTLKGLSITWGSKCADSVQFQIYDKKLERIARGKEVDVQTWVRYEMRFYRNHTDAVIKELYEGMVRDGAADKTIKGLIADRFQLRSHSFENHPERVALYKPWADLLGSVDRIPINRISQYSVEDEVTRARKYIDRQLGKLFLKVYLSNPNGLEKYIAENIVDAATHKNAIDEQLVAAINYSRFCAGLVKINTIEARCLVESLAKKYGIQTSEYFDDSDLPF